MDCQQETPEYDLRGTHVLLVEDDADCREMLRFWLESCGARVTAAASAAEALTLLAPDRPTVVVTDLNMPDGDGFDLFAAVQERMEGDWIPGVMVTGTPLDRFRERARKAGFAAILPKPVDLDSLSALVRKLSAEG